MAEPESIGQVLRNSPMLVQAKASPSLPMTASEAALRDSDRIRAAEARLKCSGVEDRHLSKSPEVLRQHKEWSAMVDRAWKLLEASAPILAFLGDRGNGKTQRRLARGLAARSVGGTRFRFRFLEIHPSFRLPRPR